MAKKITIMVCAVFVLCSFFLYAVFAGHGQTPKWVNESKDANGFGCCGKFDCVPLGAVEVSQDSSGMAHIIIDGAKGLIPWKKIVDIMPCPKDDQRPFICLRSGDWCPFGHNDCRPERNVIVLDQIRCLLIPKCGQGES